MMTSVSGIESRVLLLAPTKRDSSIAETLLARADIPCTPCPDLGTLCDELAKGAAAVLMAEEALRRDNLARFETALKDQPPWSDCPVIILTRAGFDSSVAAKAMDRLGNVTLVERPVRVPTFISAIRTAVRSRQRQYQIRQHLFEREHAERVLRESEERLRLIMENVYDHAIYTLDVEGDISGWNTGAERVFGYTREEMIGKPGSLVFGQDREGVERFDEEIRTCIERGRATSEGWLFRKDGSRFWGDGSTDRLQDRLGNLKGFVRIVSDRTDRRQTEERLRENDRRKDEFLAMLAHELRNPLSAISNAVQIVKRTDAKDHHPWASQVIENHVVHLARMIDDLLDVSRITRGKIKLKKEIVDVAHLVRSAVETASHAIEERKHRLDLFLDPGPIPVHGDPTRLEQVFVNLLNNAAKYTEPGGKILVSLRVQEGGVVFSVEDNGIGMPTELVTIAFDLFVQGDRAIARSEGGLGIGLTLVRSLVNLHGGEVSAESEGLGHGSRFSVRLPLVEQAERRHEARPTDVPAGAARVLVVDDNVDAAESLAQLLVLSGHSAVTRHDGLSALEKAREMRPDVVLLDIGLPGMDGFEVARLLRAKDYGDPLIVAVSGYGERQTSAEARDAGFHQYLVKPVDLAALLSLIAAHMAR